MPHQAHPRTTRCRRLHALLVSALLVPFLLLGAAAAQPDLAPRALGADELDPVVVARLALRFQADVLAMEVLPRSGAAGMVLGASILGQTVLLETYGSTAVGGDDLGTDHPLDLAGMFPLLPEVASAREVMALADLLTQEEAVRGEDVLAWRVAARAPQPAAHPALPDGSGMMAGTVTLGHRLLRKDAQRPDVRSLVLLSPQLDTLLFVHLLGLPETPRDDADQLLAASGSHDAAEVLAEGLWQELWGDLRLPGDPWQGWPVVQGETAEPRAGLYLPADEIAGGWAPTLRAALRSAWRLEPLEEGGLRWTPPTAVAATHDYLLAPDGLFRRSSDGAPVIVLGAAQPADDAPMDVGVLMEGQAQRLRLQAPVGLDLQRLPRVQHPHLGLAVLLAAGLAALLVLVSWPWGHYLRGRRLEPRGWELPRVVRRVRGLSRFAAVPALLLSTALGWMAWQALAGAELPMAVLTPLLQTLVVWLALGVVAMAFGVLAGLIAYPRGSWRWGLHALAMLGFSALLALGWVWKLWSPEAFRWWG